MCGFAGLFHPVLPEPESALRERLSAMAATLRHRGPDAETSFVGRTCGVAFRRLSIIDLATGDQPVANADGTVQVFLNGEIYNHVELRERVLRESGVRLESGSDAVVLPYLYERHGPDFVHLLNGMFAICVIDGRTGEVRLYRDRLGIKPLYWASAGERVVFGSELKPIFASGLVPAVLDPTRVVPFLELFYVPGRATLAHGVTKVLPGEEVLLDPGRAPRCRKWYRLAEPRPLRDGPSLDELDALLADAVRLQLVADVPVGISLSGGIDSCLVAHYAQGADVRAFTVALPDTDPSEIETARMVATTFGIEHVEVRSEPGDFLDDLASTAWFNDEPVADPAFYPALLVARAASRHVKVLLSGTGGDELFAGYGHYAMTLRAHAYSALAPVVGDGAAVAMLGWKGPDDRRAAALERRRDRLPFHAAAMTHLTPHDRRALAAVPSADPLEELRTAFRDAGWMDPRNQQLYADAVTYLPHQILGLLDRTTMAASVEGRVPLLDHRVAELTFAVHGRHKFGRIGGSKLLLRRLARRHLPKCVVSRKKQGFPSSVRDWLVADRLPAIRDRLLAGGGLCAATLPKPWVEGLVADPAALQRNALTVHSLLVLEEWHRQFVRGATELAPASVGGPSPA